MDEPRYRGLLFGEISALTQANRIGLALTSILERADLHPRLVNGSDCPLPAINVVFRTGLLVDHGYLSEAGRRALNEIYSYNPLRFDSVLKRTVRSPGTGRKFAPEIFSRRIP
jgi:mannonate dehydratase